MVHLTAIIVSFFLLNVNALFTIESRVKRELYAFCFDGTRAVSACFPNYRCNLGYRCDIFRNYCCPPITMPLCPDNRLAVAACIRGQCSNGYYCSSRSLCCPNPSTSPPIDRTNCPGGQLAAGTCLNGQCGDGYFCNGNNLCCQSSSQQCQDGSPSVGACNNGKCGSELVCSSTGYCCPIRPCQDGSSAIGTCLNGRCENGLICSPAGFCCPVLKARNAISVTCPGGALPAGTCPTGTCSLPYHCVTGSVCCSVTGYRSTGARCNTLLDCNSTNDNAIACIDGKCVVF